ncbi:hypothetical protein IAR55_004969 [Kwoniella newhampshirensis]|uniref:Uncharacterized protein n=1 Tax=Kwoniella newhampshirensis TaxID=1651941 RepID=A0AAW0YNE5_9TREE
MPSWVTDNVLADQSGTGQAAGSSTCGGNEIRSWNGCAASALQLPSTDPTATGVVEERSASSTDKVESGRAHSPIVLSPSPGPDDIPDQSSTNQQNSVESATTPANAGISTMADNTHPLSKFASAQPPTGSSLTNLPASSHTATAAEQNLITISDTPVSMNAVAGRSSHNGVQRSIETRNGVASPLVDAQSSSIIPRLSSRQSDFEEFDLQIQGGQTFRNRMHVSVARYTHVFDPPNAAQIRISSKDLLLHLASNMSVEDVLRANRDVLYLRQLGEKTISDVIQDHASQARHIGQQTQSGRHPSTLSLVNGSLQQQPLSQPQAPAGPPLRRTTSTPRVGVSANLAAGPLPRNASIQSTRQPVTPHPAAQSNLITQPVLNVIGFNAPEGPAVARIRKRREEALRKVSAHLSEAWSTLTAADDQTYEEMNSLVALLTQHQSTQNNSAVIFQLQAQLANEKKKESDLQNNLNWAIEQSRTCEAKYKEANEKLQATSNYNVQKEQEIRTLRDILQRTKAESQKMTRATQADGLSQREERLSQEVRKLTVEKASLAAEKQKVLDENGINHRKGIEKLKKEQVKEIEVLKTTYEQLIHSIRNNHNGSVPADSASDNDAQALEVTKLRVNIRKNNQKMAELEEARKKEVEALKLELAEMGSAVAVRERMKELSKRHTATQKELVDEKSGRQKEVGVLTEKIIELEKVIQPLKTKIAELEQSAQQPASPPVPKDSSTRKALEHILQWGENIQRLVGREASILTQKGEFDQAEEFCNSLQLVLSEVQERKKAEEGQSGDGTIVEEMRNQFRNDEGGMKAKAEELANQKELLAEIKSQLETTKSALAAKESDMDELRTEMSLVADQTANKVIDTKAERDALKTQVDNKSQEIQRLKDENNDMKRRLDGFSQHLMTSTSERLADREELSTMEQQIEKLRDERNQWKERYKTAQTELKAAKRPVTSGGSQNTTADTRIKEEPAETASALELNQPSQSDPSRSPILKRKTAQVTPLFLPRDDDDIESQPLFQAGPSVPPMRKRRRIDSPEDIASPHVLTPTGSGTFAIDRPVKKEWIDKNLSVCIQTNRGETRCKLCFVQEKKTAVSSNKAPPRLEEIDPLPSSWTRSRIIDHVHEHQVTLRKLKDKRVKDGKEAPSP